MMILSSENKKFLLDLAKESIKCFLNTGKKIEVPKNYIPPELQENGAVFVTLTLDNNLRGCIGNLQAFQPLYLDVVENSINSAFYDSRFKPLSEEELKQIKIEISIIGKPEKLKYKNPGELVYFLNREKPGIILQKGSHSATFLPQVWEQLKTTEEFLSHLCLKAGLSANEWQKNYLEIEFYKVEKIQND